VKTVKSPLVRCAKNPILTPAMMPFDCYTVMNAGATRFEGDVLLLLRVETRERKTRFHVARSRDGIDFEVNPEPVRYPLTELDRLGTRPHRFDMRITRMGEVYYVFHANWLDPWGSLINLAKTTDFVNFEPVSHSVPANRNAVLFPEKINGRYARLERPQNIDGRGAIWYSESPDLEFWGRSMPVMLPATDWAQFKQGAGCVPVRTPHGWLEIYHATAMTASTENYYLGACLLDLDEPWKVVAAPKSFLLAAEELYECVGQTPNVVFAGGGCEMDDGSYFLYYGAADTRMCMARTTISELVDFCLEA
jgi:glycosidase PH1107-related protein